LRSFQDVQEIALSVVTIASCLQGDVLHRASLKRVTVSTGIRLESFVVDSIALYRNAVPKLRSAERLVCSEEGRF
jgi:hypothetical protein